MKKIGLFTVALFIRGSSVWVQQPTQAQPLTPAQQKIIDLSHQKWDWMAEKNADALADLFHQEAVFVHMGGAWGKQQEVDIIRGGMIHYKKATIRNESVRFAEGTAVVLCDMDLLAVVGGNEVTNHFMVTEVFVKQGDAWKLASLSFTKLMQP